MSEDKPERPTAQIPAVTEAEVTMRRLETALARGFENLDEKVTRLESNVGLIGGEVGIVKREVALLFDWKGDVDSRLKSNSIRAHSASQVDIETSSALTFERERRVSLEKDVSDTKAKVGVIEAKTDAQTVLLREIVKLTEKPLVKLIATAVGTAILGYFAAKGVH